MHLVENISLILSHRSPRTWNTNHTHSIKRIKVEGDKGTITSHPKNNMEGSQSQTCHKVAIPSIQIVVQMWHGYPIHEAMTIQQGKSILKETWLDEGFFNMGTLLTKIEEFRILHQAFPRVYQCLYPHEWLDAVPRHHVQFTQLPRHETVKQNIVLSKGFHITICFDIGFTSMSKGNAHSACLDCLYKTNVLLDMDYWSPIAIGLNQITKIWVGFLKLHLKHPLRDGLMLLRGECAFVMELERSMGHQ